MCETRLIARYSETDQMGIIHHGIYINWFEVGRTDLIRTVGKSYKDLENEGLWLPVINVGLQYKEPAKYDDTVLIETSIASYNGIRIRFNYKVVNEANGRLLVTGYTEHCWTDPNMKPISIKKHHPALHDQLEGLYKETANVS